MTYYVMIIYLGEVGDSHIFLGMYTQTHHRCLIVKTRGSSKGRHPTPPIVPQEANLPAASLLNSNHVGLTHLFRFEKCVIADSFAPLHRPKCKHVGIAEKDFQSREEPIASASVILYAFFPFLNGKMRVLSPEHAGLRMYALGPF